MTGEQVGAYFAAQRVAQGKGEKCADPVILAQVAEIVNQARTQRALTKEEK